MDKSTSNARSGFISVPVWVMIVTGINTLFYIQALRDIPIAPGITDRLLPLAATMLLAPVAAALLTWLWKPAASLMIGTALAIAGRYFMFAPDQETFVRGLFFVFTGYPMFFVGVLSFVNKRSFPSRYRSFGAALVAGGIMWAAAFHLLIRRFDNAYNQNMLSAFFVVVLLLALWGLFSSRWAGESKVDTKDANAENEECPAGGAAKTFILLLMGFPLHFAFMVFGKPEFLASRCAAPFDTLVIAVVVGVTAGFGLAVAWEITNRPFRKAINYMLLIGNIAAAAYFYLLYDLSPAGWQVWVVAVCAALTVLTLHRILAFAVAQASWVLPLAAGLAMSLAALLTFGVDAGVLLENHIPAFHGYFFIPLALVSLITLKFTAGYKGEARSERPHRGFGAVFTVFAMFLIIPCMGFYSSEKADRAVEASQPEPLVFASLYTWYGAPGGTLGSTFQGIDFKREGAGGDFEILDSNMKNVEIVDNDKGLFRVRGESLGAEGNKLTLGFEMPAALVREKPKMYITMAYIQNKPVDNLWLSIVEGGKQYRTKMSSHTRMYNERYTFPDSFKVSDTKETTPAGTARLTIGMECREPGEYIIDFDFVRFSRWRHWDEDFKTYYDKEKKLWYNDPPKTLAAAHKVRYVGTPWPDIESYSNFGYYDSMDTRVMRSQLKLMQKAGIDVVLFMHPYSADVIRKGIELIKENNLNLKVSWYWTGDDVDGFVKEMMALGRDPLWAKTNGKPIVVIGPTGLREKPFEQYRGRFEQMTKAGIFVVGDSYAPPKDELLSLVDGQYYYDTTGLYRARWGGKDIEVAQPDGTFVTGYGHLFTIFDAVSKITHAHHDVFLATVIPGFDNTSVHGFEGSPLYDGRPGTIVKRHDGKTYAETWRAAIDSGADWVCIVSWNELHEGTEIEPTLEDGVKYIRLTREWAAMFKSARGR